MSATHWIAFAAIAFTMLNVLNWVVFLFVQWHRERVSVKLWKEGIRQREEHINPSNAVRAIALSRIKNGKRFRA